MRQITRKEVYTDAAGEERRQQSVEYYLAKAETMGVKNPRVERRSSHSISMERISTLATIQIQYCGEIPYWDTKLLYYLTYDVKDFTKYDSKCVCELQHRTVGERMVEIEGLRTYPEHKKAILRFDSLSSPVLLVMILKQSATYRPALLKVQEVFASVAKWAPCALRCVCIHYASSSIDLAALHITAGEHYFRKLPSNPTVPISPNSDGKTRRKPRTLLVSTAGVILMDTELHAKRLAGEVAAAFKTGPTMAPAMDPYPVKSTKLQIPDLERIFLELRNGLRESITTMRGKLDFVECYNRVTKSWDPPICLLYLACKYYPRSEAKIKEAFRLMQEQLRGLCNVKLEVKPLHKPFKLVRSDHCDSCFASLIGQDQFICPTCIPPQHFCFACGSGLEGDEEEDSKESKEGHEITHEHPLVLIQTGTTERLIEDIDPSKVKNQMYSREHSNIQCDCCGALPIIGIRWKCMNCSDRDLCNNCLQVLDNPQHPHYDTLLRRILKEGHDPRTHIHARIDFNASVLSSGASYSYASYCSHLVLLPNI